MSDRFQLCCSAESLAGGSLKVLSKDPTPCWAGWFSAMMGSLTCWLLLSLLMLATARIGSRLEASQLHVHLQHRNRVPRKQPLHRPRKTVQRSSSWQTGSYCVSSSTVRGTVGCFAKGLAVAQQALAANGLEVVIGRPE